MLSEYGTQIIQFYFNTKYIEKNNFKNNYLMQIRGNINKKISNILRDIPIPNYTTNNDLHKYILDKIMDKISNNKWILDKIQQSEKETYIIQQEVYKKLIYEIIKRGEDEIGHLMEAFLNSNISYSKFTALMQGILRINARLQIAEEKIRELLEVTKPQKYKNELIKDIESIFNGIDEILYQIIKIEIYIELFNSNSLFEVFSPKYYDIEQLNKQWLTIEIKKLYKIIEKNYVPPIPLEKFKDDPTARLFANILDIILHDL